MGTVLGMGLTHFPPLCHPDAGLSAALRWTLDDPDIPEELRRPSGWPEPMRAEWGDDEGLAAAGRHRAALVDGFHRLRSELESFQPDALLIVGDDQYENFREDVIPPFTLLAYDDICARPWHPTQSTKGVMPKENVWGEGPDTEFLVRGRRDIATALVASLLDQDFDVAYAYKPLHHQGMPHAFMNTMLFLDYDRTGFDFPVVPLAVNCYGRRVISRTGGLSRFANKAPFDPPVPEPEPPHGSRCRAARGDSALALAHRPHRLLQLVPRLPGRSDVAPPSRHAGRPASLPGLRGRRLGHVAGHQPGAD